MIFMYIKSQIKLLFKTAACTLTLGALAASVSADPGHANEDFIEGFPDIPRLAIVTEIVGEPVVFDTASGTVAEVELLISAPHTQAFSRYGNALKQLGWSCRMTEKRLSCIRGDSVVSLVPPKEQGNNQAFILRLEPRH